MHGLPDGARLNVFSFKGQTHPLPIHTKLFGSDQINAWHKIVESTPFLFGLFFYLIDEALDFADKPREIGAVKTILRCRDAIVFNVWLDMFMVGICPLQSRIIRMWLGIVPE